MNPEQSILVQLVDKSNEPLHLSRVYVDLDFYTGGNPRYGFRLNPTDGQGRLKIDYEMVEAKRAEGAKVFVMDYNTSLTDCDGRVKICIPTIEMLKTAYDGIGRWFGGETPAYAEGWLLASNGKIKAEEVFVELKGQETFVQVPCLLMP